MQRLQVVRASLNTGYGTLHTAFFFLAHCVFFILQAMPLLKILFPQPSCQQQGCILQFNTHGSPRLLVYSFKHEPALLVIISLTTCPPQDESLFNISTNNLMLHQLRPPSKLSNLVCRPNFLLPLTDYSNLLQRQVSCEAAKDLYMVCEMSEFSACGQLIKQSILFQQAMTAMPSCAGAASCGSPGSLWHLTAMFV